MIEQAEAFVRRFYVETHRRDSLGARLRAIAAEVGRTGIYAHTPDELAYGAKLAWRNAHRCIGRLYWRSLVVRDRRDVTSAKAVRDECILHLDEAFNGGAIRPTVTVFGRGVRILNEQLIRYADDPQYAAFARRYPSPARGRFQPLPLVIRDRDGEHVFKLPREAVREVAITHPDTDALDALELRWHAVPALSSMCLEIGGLHYRCAPFNGWYMGTEIGARNLADRDRYNMLPAVADALGLDRTDERTLWRDRALVELNRAVLHSFDRAGVTITDHHTESVRYEQHRRREADFARDVPGDWVWLVPPVSGVLSPIWHRPESAVRESPRFAWHRRSRAPS